MNKLEQLEQDLLRIAVCIRELSCIVGDNNNTFLRERLTRIHDDMRDIIHRV